MILDVLNFEELGQFQAFGAIPFAGSHGVLLPATFGWVVHATDELVRWHGFISKGSRKKNDKVPNLQALLKFQESYIRDGAPDEE